MTKDAYPPLERTDPRKILTNLADVEKKLQTVLEDHRDGKYGFITREWGFTTPNGLGGPLGGKFVPWEEKLAAVKNFFWPIEAYAAMEEKPYGKPDPDLVRDLPPEGEKLTGNTPLHEFLMQPPNVDVLLEEKDYADYKSAARIFLLLATLSHLCGNSAPDPKTATLPAWIENPLIDVAKRLQVEPTLTGHFVVQENWVWSSRQEDADRSSMSKSQSSGVDRAVLQTILKHCQVEDRRYRIKVYPNCFVGQQLVDILMKYDYAPSREEAVRLARRINNKYRVFYHVTGDHPLMDKNLFYRFRKKWRNKIAFGEVDEDKLVLDTGSVGGTSKDDDIADTDDESPDEWTSRMIRPLEFLTRNSSMTQSKNSALSETALLEVLSPPSARTLQQRTSESSALDVAHAHRDDSVSHIGREVSRNSQDPSVMNEFMTAIAVMSKVPVKDRRYRFKTYKQCFVGKELVDAFITSECASTRQEAVTLARKINNRFELFEHVVQDHDFKDKFLFFRFTETFRKMLDIQTEAKDDTHELGTGSNPTEGARISIAEDVLVDRGSVRSGSLADSVSSQDSMMIPLVASEEFRLDNINMLYPAFGNNHERVNQLVPSCMAYELRSLPFLVVDILCAMYSTIETKLEGTDHETFVADSFEALRLAELLHDLAFCVSRCKEQFQLMSTDSTKRGFNSKHVSIRQTQPLSNGVLVRREKGGEPRPAKGVTGTQFPYFHLLDWLLGRHQFGDSSDTGLVAQISSVDDTYPRPQREYILALGRLERHSTLRGLLDALGRPSPLLAAYNHLLECYAGEGGLLQAHSRKLYSYIHNDVQFSTSGTNHLSSKHDEPTQMMSKAQNNHLFATTMFEHMRNAADERWRLRVPPLMTKANKMVYSTSESGGYTTVALDLRETGLEYTYGDVVKVLLPNDDRTAFAWSMSFGTKEDRHFKLEDMQKLHKDTGNGWGWTDLWEALDWCKYEKDGGSGVPLQLVARYIEQGQILEDGSKPRWVNSPLDLCGKKDRKLFAIPPKIDLSHVSSLEPVSPRIYSVSGVEPERVFLLVSKPQDGARHHGYERMSDSSIRSVYCSFSPATAFLVPPKKSNLVCIASGTGISPFVGLSDAIGMRRGTTTIVHQCKSSELFLCNSQHWLDFTASNPGACVMGFISGDQSRRNCPMRYIVQNGSFEETTILGRRSASAYYFECALFKARVQETYIEGGINLAYCCGGVNSAIQPFKDIVSEYKLNFEFTLECYGVSATLQQHSVASQIGGTIVNLDHVSPIHPGGDQILHQVQDIEIEKLKQSNSSVAVPDHSVAFWQCHPHAYNLHRCLRAPFDADSEAFASFLELQAMSQSVMVSMASNYAEVALSSPNDSKVVRIATELQAWTLRQQIKADDQEGAFASASNLEALLVHVSSKDDDARRWVQLLQDFKDKSNIDST